MSLTAGKGPLGKDPAGWFSPPLPGEAAGPTRAGPRPGDIVFVEPHPRRVVAVRDGETVLDTESVLLVHRAGHPLSYAFRPDDVGALPHEVLPEAPGWVRVPWDAVDSWFEEGRELVDYPPNPYHRVDCRPTTRRLRVEVAGTVLVDTDDTVILFETSLDPRLYVDPSHVRTDLLRRSDTSTYCNYKGHTTYWDAVIPGHDGLGSDGAETVITDVAWSYDDPLPESVAIAGMLSFDHPDADVLADLPTLDV